MSIIGDELESTVHRLRAATGRDIWLFGGGQLAASLLAMNLIDVIEIAVMPVILGAGVPLVDHVARQVPLDLSRVHHSSHGIIHLQYDVARTDALHPAG